MPIKYSCINDGGAMVAEYPEKEQAKLGDTMQKVLATVPHKQYRRKTLEDKPGNVNYHYISNGDGKVVGCVTTPDVRMRTVFAFLEAVETVIRPPTADLGNAKKILQQKMEHFNNPQNDKITAINEEINQVTDIMMDNMDKVIERGDKVDQLHTKSISLSEQAEQFKQKSTTLKRRMCVKNAKMAIMIVAGVFVLALIISMFACGVTFSRCTK
eukprot:Tbor_TRINITY_DN5337_c3_g2::TRINITY_DN5337_c3_g2_i1::g.4219::m.4219/K08515/VAMP7; vesicle-associated membrane protein 7